MAARSFPRSWNCSCLRPPPKSLVNTESVTPATFFISPRSSFANCSTLLLRLSFGTVCT